MLDVAFNNDDNLQFFELVLFFITQIEPVLPSIEFFGHDCQGVVDVIPDFRDVIVDVYSRNAEILSLHEMLDLVNGFCTEDVRKENR